MQWKCGRKKSKANAHKHASPNGTKWDATTTTTLMEEGRKGWRGEEADKENLRVASWCDRVSSCILIAMCERANGWDQKKSESKFERKIYSNSEKAHKRQETREEEARPKQ